MNKKTIILVLVMFLVVSFTFGCTNTQSEGDDQSGDQENVDQQEDKPYDDSSDKQETEDIEETRESV
ncbi:MAG: hypothetical protein QME14_07160 [Methanobacteriaceae archaeon]|nr:hypothetical protein [Methanobacteriaceae archaeon]